MVYKKYFYKNGKKYGPYSYQNERIDGKVVTSYIGKPEEVKGSANLRHEKLVWLYVFLIIVALLIVLDIFVQLSPTGWFLLDLQPKFFQGENLRGSINLRFSAGELIPINSLLYMSLGNENQVYNLGDVISEPELLSGNFYAKNTYISGEGSGVGLMGEKVSYPVINFKILIKNSESENVDNSEQTSSEDNSSIDSSSSESSNDNSNNAEQTNPDTSGAQENPTASVDNSVSENSDSASSDSGSQSTSESTQSESSSQETSSSDSSSDSSSSDSSSSDSSSSDSSSSDSSSSDSSSSDSSSSDSSSSDSSSSDSSSSDSSSSDSSSSDSSSSDSSSSGSITGNAISELEFEFSGSVSADNDFSYNLENGQTAELIPGSVEIDGEKIDDGIIKIKQESDKLKITTEYKITQEGFGEEFYDPNKTFGISIDLEKLNLTALNSTLNVKIIYNENLIAEAARQIIALPRDSENITIEQNISNISNLFLIKEIPTLRIKSGESFILNLSEYFDSAEEFGIAIDNISALFEGSSLILTPDSGFRGSRKAKILAYSDNRQRVIESNSFLILVSSGAVVIDTSRDNIKVGEPVKWKLNITLDIPEDISIDIPASAENVSIVGSSLDDGEIKETSVYGEIKNTDSNGNEVTEKIIEPSSESENQDNSFSNPSLVGNVVADINLKKRPSIFVTFFKKLTSLTGHVIEGDVVGGDEASSDSNNSLDVQSELLIVTQENITNYVVEFTTPAPVASEENTTYGKQVIVSAPSELNYTDVLSFTNISEIYSVGEEDKIKIYWLENKSYLAFDAYDLDGNDKLDYVEWITPHLSNQTFEIILITKAQHLDSNKSFISDIYEQVKAQDGNWSEIINDGEYVRVTFEKLLTNKNDVTVYAKVSCKESSNITIDGKDVPCEIYLKKLQLDKLRRENG